jgi:hypothetical protein
MWYSQDNPGELPEDLRRRVAICPDCREYHQNMLKSMHVLQTLQRSSVQADPALELRGSLWPKISQRLEPQASPALNRPLRSYDRTNEWSRWIAAVSITAALLTITVGPLSEMILPNSQQPQSFMNTPHPVSFQQNSMHGRPRTMFSSPMIGSHAHLPDNMPVYDVNGPASTSDTQWLNQSAPRFDASAEAYSSVN